MSAVADVLSGAADLIERDGWCQGRYRDVGGGYCLAGAIDTVSGCFGRLLSTHAIMARQAVAAVVDAHPTKWQDAPGRTKAEVVAALRAAAERAS